MYELVQVILHLDQHLAEWMLLYGNWIYLILFLIIFCETGLIVTPFLPGDSLLFALGALTAMTEGGLSIGILSVLLVVAAFCGDNTNYYIGSKIGYRVLQWPDKPWLKKAHIRRTQEFMNDYGKMAVILARFAPLLRTFVPFVAGLGTMNRKIYLTYSLVGAVLWTQSFLWLGHLFGQTPFVKKNFTALVLGVIVVSLIPAAVAFLKARQTKPKASA